MDSNDDHFSLKWKNFRSSLTEGFHDFLQEEMMVDVTLAAEGKFLQAHKLVLSICSPYFKNLFSINPCKHPIVILKDVSHHELSYVLQFMYKGEVGVKHEELPSFLKLAETLKLKGLTGIKVEDGKIGCSQMHSNHSSSQKKRDILCSANFDAENSESESNTSRLKDMRPSKLRKRRLSKAMKSESSKSTHSKKLKSSRTERERKYSCDEDAEFVTDEDDNEALVKLVVDKARYECIEKSDTPLSADNLFNNEDIEGEKSLHDECDLSASIFDSSSEVEQAPQGGVDYQMIQTKRGKDMLLYDGFTFTQNRMCKDGMRWQCSFPKCRAFCRMSSAGWLTPYKTNHDHPKPSDEEIKKRILRMELKARAQSSGATPGEIIRNALPAEEYQSTDQRACYTRCIQRFRKSLQKKHSKPSEESWQSQSAANSVRKEVEKPGGLLAPEDPACATKAHSTLSLSDKRGVKEEPMWTAHSDTTKLTESEDRQSNAEQKPDLHGKLGSYGM